MTPILFQLVGCRWLATLRMCLKHVTLTQIEDLARILIPHASNIILIFHTCVSYRFSSNSCSNHPHPSSSIFDSATAWWGRGQARRRIVIGLRSGVDEVINPKRLLIGGEKCTLLVHWVHGIHCHHSL